jgi:hypothetical protein
MELTLPRGITELVGPELRSEPDRCGRETPELPGPGQPPPGGSAADQPPPNIAIHCSADFGRNT